MADYFGEAVADRVGRASWLKGLGGRHLVGRAAEAVKLLRLRIRWRVPYRYSDRAYLAYVVQDGEHYLETVPRDWLAFSIPFRQLRRRYV